MNRVLTGGTSGLGFRAAEVLGKEIKNKIILIGSNKQKGKTSVENLIKETSNSNISFIQCDLSSISEIKSLAEKLKKFKIDILINNAGAIFFSRNKLFESRRISPEDGHSNPIRIFINVLLPLHVLPNIPIFSPL